ncbi:MAG: TolC family outer membrane protein, partial [Pseudomonadota bacterium]
MKNTRLFAFLAVLTGTWLAAPAYGATLLEVYQQALQSDPLIREADARRLAALEAKPQARGAYLPQISASGEYTVRNNEGTSVGENADGTFGTNFVETESARSDWRLSLRQTLFRWDQIVGLKRAEKEVSRAEFVRESAQQDLIVRVVQRYFDVLAAEDNLLAIHANRLAIARQLEQAKQRFEVGLIAITDVQESQAAFDSATADEIAAKRDLATAREFLREITGEYVTELAAPEDRLPLRSPEPLNETAWIDMSLEQNVDLTVSRIDEQLARDEISQRRGGRYPTVDLVAGYGENDDDADRNVNNRGFLPADSDGSGDSIGLEVTVPLFTGGSTSSRIREAV